MTKPLEHPWQSRLLDLMIKVVEQKDGEEEEDIDEALGGSSHGIVEVVSHGIVVGTFHNLCSLCSLHPVQGSPAKYIQVSPGRWKRF